MSGINRDVCVFRKCRFVGEEERGDEVLHVNRFWGLFSSLPHHVTYTTRSILGIWGRYKLREDERLLCALWM
jgi:hypothetical protein